MECAAVRLLHGLPCVCFFLKTLLFSLEEKLAVDFLDSRHDEVSLCRSQMDHFNIYLLILPLSSQLCPSAEVTFLHIPLNSSFFRVYFCFIPVLILSSWLRRPVEFDKC